MIPVSARWGPLPLPLWLFRIAARETACADAHLFDVRIALPLIGRLAHYRGHLTIRRDAAPAPAERALIPR